jgi:hypothetical protein
MSNTETLRNQAIQALLIAEDPSEQRSAAQVIAKIASLDLPDGWPKLWPGLLSILENPATAVPVSRAILTCIAYIASEVDESSIPPATVNRVLTHCVNALQPTQKDSSLKQAAIACIGELLQFCAPIFSDPARKRERDYLVTIITNSCLDADEEIRARALESLADMGSWYYGSIAEYMPRCFDVTEKVISAIDEDGGRDGLMALEFWAMLGEQENERLGPRASKNFLSLAVDRLAPVMWTVMTTKRDAAETTPTVLQDTTSHVHIASEVLRQMVLQMDPGKAVSMFRPLLEANFGHPDWRIREACLSVMGYLFEKAGQSKDAGAAVSPLANSYYPKVMAKLVPGPSQDSDPRVRPPLLWVAGLALEYSFDAVAIVGEHELITPTVGLLCTSVRDEAPGPAKYAAFCLSSLAMSARDKTNPRTGRPWMVPELVSHSLNSLMAGMSRRDGTVGRLSNDCMAAFGDVIRSAGPECLGVVVESLRLEGEAMRALGTKFYSGCSSTAEKELVDHQLSFVCGALAYTIPEFDRLAQEAPPGTPAVASGGELITSFVDSLLAVLDLGTVHANSEAWAALPSAITITGPSIEAKLPRLGTRILEGLRSVSDPAVCLYAVGCVEAVAVALDKALAKYLPSFFDAIKTVCESDMVDRMVKPAAVGCIGGLAGCAGFEAFKPLLPSAGSILAAAEKPLLSPGDDDGNQWVFDLRTSVLGSYSGCINIMMDVDPAYREVGKGIGLQAVRFVRRLVDEISRMSAEQYSDLPPLYLNNMVYVITDLSLIFTPGVIASEVSAKDSWVQSLCTLADRICLPANGTSPGTVCMHTLKYGVLPRS